MANYVKSQSFTALRGQTPADPAVFDIEFLRVASASASKVDKTGGSMTGYLNVPAGATGAQAPQRSEVDAAIAALLPVGTRLAFFQPSAPLGWVQEYGNNDALLRVVSTVGGGVGGTASIAAGLAAGTTAGHALTIAEIPSHSHTGTYNAYGGTSNQDGGNIANAKYSNPTQQTGLTGGNAAHTHSFPAWQPKYVDMIICTKI